MPDGHKGVGVIINSKIRNDIANVKFVAIHCRLCFLDLAYGNSRWRIICVYMPDPWSSSLDETQTIYCHAAFIIQQAKIGQRFILMCGNFNASVGNIIPNEDLTSVGNLALILGQRVVLC